MKERPLRPLAMALIALSIGAVAGIGAVIFRALIALFHNLIFLGRFSTFYDANRHTEPSPWGVGIVAAVVLAALLVVYLTQTYAPEARGHGVPEVMDAIYYQRGRIRPVVAVVKSLASALSIGSGGSVGREGPIIQIGATLGSIAAGFLRLPLPQRITLIAAGAGAGIAATFNTPVGGVLFALEILLHEVSVRTLVPVALATAAATYLGRLFFGPHPSFVIPSFETPYFALTAPTVLLAYLGLGLLTGLASALYIRTIYGFEDFFLRRFPRRPYLRHAVGMAGVALIFYLLLVTTGRYYLEGVGYATVQDVLMGQLGGVGFLLLLFALKLVATGLTLGSGASGGIFSPGLFLGATLGGAYGRLLAALFPALAISPPAFAVAGMAGMIGGATGAAVTAIVIIFEMTLDYSAVLPMAIAVAASYGLRKALVGESIYTMKLERRGHPMPDALQTNFQYMLPAAQAMDRRLVRVMAETSVGAFLEAHRERLGEAWFVAYNGAKLLGYLSPKAALRLALAAHPEDRLGPYLAHDFVLVGERRRLFNLIAAMRRRGASVAIVLGGKDGGPVGVVAREQLGALTLEVSELYLPGG